MLPTKFRFIWPSGFREVDFFRNRPMINKNCLWWPCLLTDRDKLSNLYRGTSIDPSYQVSVQFAKQFQKRKFLEIAQSETRIDCDGHVWYRIGDEMSNVYREPSIDTSYQVSVHLAKGLQRRKIKCEKLTNEGRQVLANKKMLFKNSNSTRIVFTIYRVHFSWNTNERWNLGQQFWWSAPELCCSIFSFLCRIL